MAVGEPILGRADEFEPRPARDSVTRRRTVAFSEAFRFWVKLGFIGLAWTLLGG